MPTLTGGLEGALAAAGLPLVAVGAFLEGDTVAVLSGALAHRGAWSLPGAALAAALGAMLSDQMWFQVGRRLKDARRVRRLLAGPAAARGLDLLARRPTLALLGYRFVWGTRVAAPVAFGAAGVAVGRFTRLSVLAGVAWGFLFTGIGYGLGHAVEAAVGRLGLGRHLGLVALAALAALLGGWLALRRLRRGRA